MRRRMKQLMDILLSLALMLGLIPGMSLTVYADEPYASLKNTTTVVHFDSKEWYLIDYDSSTVTLLAKECVDASAFNSNGSSNEYSGSTVESAVNTYYTDSISSDAKTAVNGSGMFLLTTEQAHTIENANKSVLECSWASGADLNYWWLRSPGGGGNRVACVFCGLGTVYDGGNYVWNTCGVRPALQLNLSKVTFDSSSNTFSLPAVGTYTVIASDDGNGSASADPESGETGTKVTIKATPNNGCSFKEWEVISGGITLADKNSAETTFNIGSANVEVKAHFEKKSQPEPSPEPEPKPKRESKSEKKSEEHSSKPAVINPDTVEGYFLVNGQILPGVAMGKTRQGPAAQIVLNANRPTGWLEAFTFNMAISGKVDYTLKNGVLTIIIPLEYQKAGRTFAIMALDKNGKAWTFADIDKNPSTVTANINVEGYAFAPIYKD